MSIRMKSGSVTLKDLAKELGISASTVSRALDNNPLVKRETKEAVQKLAEKHRYQPNFTALSLRNNSTRTIGMIIPRLVHEFFASVVRGVEEYAYSNGYNLIICVSHNSYEREVIDSKALLGRVDGLLVCLSPETQDFDHLKQFQHQNIPLVLYDCICDELDCHRVTIDDYQAGYKATSHLTEIGCKNIGFIGGPESLKTNQKRLEGFKDALRDSKIAFDDSRIAFTSKGDFIEGKKACKDLLSNNKLDGLFTVTDMLGIGAIKTAKEYGLEVPHDLAVVGFSNWEVSEIYEPSLTTVAQPGHEIGLKACELVINAITSEEPLTPVSSVLETSLLIRESSKRS